MKIVKTLLCGAFIALASCSNGPADKVISFYEGTAVDIEKATTANEFIKISRDAMSRLDELESDPDIRNYKPSASDEENVGKAMDRLQKAVDDAEARFNVSLDNLW